MDERAEGQEPWLICAFEVGEGGDVRDLSSNDIEAPPPERGWRWVHLDRTRPEAQAWLRAREDLPRLAVEALLAEETRPRVREVPEEPSR